MKEVAAVAGVSLATVSRVVNGAPDVAPALAERVNDAIRMLGYRRDLTASMLRRADRASATIGLLLEDVANPFFSALHRSVEDVARTRGHLVFAGSSDEDPQRERELVESLVARGVDGVIIAPTSGDHGYLLRDREAGVAMVFVDRPPRYVDADSIVSDNQGGAARAVEHLVAGGHRRIAFVGDRPDFVYTAAERLRGYRRAMQEHGLEELVLPPVAGPEQAREAIHGLLTGPDKPTALFTAQNLVTIGAVLALRDAGLQHSTALVGFDDVTLADALEPPVSVVAQDPAELGRRAAEILFARIDGDDQPTQHVVVPTPLIARGSGEIAPG
jgi:LacI family transcriptional regulator